MIARKIFTVGIITVPFSAVAGLPGLGEVQHELSTYFFLAAMWLAFMSTLPGLDVVGGSHRFRLPRVYLLPRVFLAVLAIILISFVFNFVSISTDHFRGRYGLTKFLFSLVVIFFGFGLAYLTYFMARYDWQKTILFPIAISVLICAFYAIFEVLAWSGILREVYVIMHSMTHGGFDTLIVKWNGTLKKNIDWDMRLKTVSFEPPAFGNYAGYIWPWMLAGVAAHRGFAKAFYAFTFLCLNIMLILCNARTGIVMVVGSIIVVLLLRFVYLPANPRPNYLRISGMTTFSLYCGAVIAAVVGYMHFDDMIYGIIAGDSISNISRMASQMAAFNMFAAQPLFGVGFGQFGFHISQYLPYWGYYSWELQPWLIFPEAPWPAVYSIYARLAAEMGLLGLIAWVAFWVTLARRLTIVSRHCQNITGSLPMPSYPLIMGCYCTLTSSLAYDSFRIPMIWITLGLAARYLEEIRQLTARHITEAQTEMQTEADLLTQPHAKPDAPGPLPPVPLGAA